MSGEKNSIPVVNIDDSLLGCSNQDIEKVTLIMTKGCNLSCDYCFEKHFPEQKMTPDTAYGAIEKYQPSIVKFFGGEPMINRKLMMDIMDTYPDKSFELTTNGIYIKKMPLKYWDQMSFTNISLDGVYYKDTTRWTNKLEYDAVIENIQWLVGETNPDKYVMNITTSKRTMYDYTLLDRVHDVYLLTGVAHFDINIVVYNSDGVLELEREDREEFLKQCYELYMYSIEHKGLWDIGLNEAVFATKDASNTCCAFVMKKQAAIDVNGFENHCHVAAYYNTPNEVLEKATAESDAACVMIELMGQQNGKAVELDRENFNAISKAEELNNGMYYSRTDERIIYR